MKNASLFRSGFVIGIGFLSSIALFVGAYAAYSTLSVNGGDTLSALKWNELLKYTNPPGTIIAYSGTTCPTNWSEYTLARGKFLRGYDPAASYDPEGVSRTIGSVQTDAFQGHYHDVYDSIGGSTDAPYWHQGSASNMGANFPRNTSSYIWGWKAKDVVTDGTNGVPRISSETRPKNVVVLFCIKD